MSGGGMAGRWRRRRAALLLVAPAAFAVAIGHAAERPGPGAGAAEPKRAALRRQLVERLERLRAELPGAAGYCIRDLGTGETFEADAGAVFPAASTIKIPVLLSLLRLAQEGTIDLHRPIPIDPAARVEGGGVLETWSEPYPALSAAHLAALMMDFSDNFATNLLIDRVGMERIGSDLRAWGLRDTRLRRRMMDLEAARDGRENVTTPRDMVALLERLHGGGLLDAAHTVRALSMMKRNGGTPIKSALPPGVEAADKEGDLDGVRCASGIVFVPAPGGTTRPFALSVMTAFLRDDGAGNPYIVATTRAAFEYLAGVANSSEYGRRMEP